MNNVSQKTRTLTLIALFAAIATVLMYFEIPLPFMPPFLKIDPSSVPILIGSFILGPVPAVIMAAIKAFVHLLSTQTGGVGEIADFLITSSFALTAGLLYRRNKSTKGVVSACIAGVIAITLMGALANRFLLIPFYSTIMPVDAIVAACNAINPLIDSIDAYILFGVVPFNMIKGILVSIITVLTYKKLAHALVSLRMLPKEAVAA